MIHYIKHDDVDTEKWDRCINKAYNGMVYGYSWYLDVVCKEWDALVEDDYYRVFPITANKKAGIHYMYQPLFTQQLGIFSQGILNEEITRQFLEAIPSKYRLIEINLNAFNKPDIEKAPSHYIENRNYELDLIPPYEEIKKHYSKNLKRNLKKAEKEGITFMKSVKPEDVIDIFRKHRGKYIKKLDSEAYRKLKHLIYVLIYRGRGQVWGAYDSRNNMVAGAVFVKSSHKWIFLFSGTSSDAREMGAMPYLLDRFIFHNAHSNATFDFEGSNDENLARFYRSFGAKQCSYYQYTRNSLPWLVKNGVNAVKKLKNSIK
ncbi:MAG: GNAT family N-acetyltransferase [Bacteroidales bacterium]|nr:GNAT family N-acetyltransferase [Bacteroidales bacterium]MCF8338973.1 GNAT family N-acetyltransferase [Bacteroidales bacterium]